MKKTESLFCQLHKANQQNKELQRQVEELISHLDAAINTTIDSTSYNKYQKILDKYKQSTLK